MARPSTLTAEDMEEILAIAASMSERHRLNLIEELALGGAISQAAIQSIRKAKRDA